MKPIPHTPEDITILISDVHLGHSACNVDAFRQFVAALKQKPPTRLIIDGDLIDLWRRSNAAVLIEYADILRDLFELPCEIVYIRGNHDFLIDEIAEETGKYDINLGHWVSNPDTFRQFLGDLLRRQIKFLKDYRFRSGDEWVYVLHGDRIDALVTMESIGVKGYEKFSSAMCRADDTLGGLASLLWSAITIAGSQITKLRAMIQGTARTDAEYDQIYKVFHSGAVHFLCGAYPGDLIVFAHTHWPSINKAGSVANTGSWCTEEGVPRNNTYVKITGGVITLHQYTPGKPIF